MKNIGEVIETYALLTVAAFLMSLGVVWIFNSEQIVPGLSLIHISEPTRRS